MRTMTPAGLRMASLLILGAMCMGLQRPTAALTAPRSLASGKATLIPAAKPSRCPASESSLRLRGGCEAGEGGDPPGEFAGKSAAWGITRSESYACLDTDQLTPILRSESNIPEEAHIVNMVVGSTHANQPPSLGGLGIKTGSSTDLAPGPKSGDNLPYLTPVASQTWTPGAWDEAKEDVLAEQAPVVTETPAQLEARLLREAEEAERENARLRIVIVSSEVAPWSKSGGLADVAEKLSIALSRRGHRVMTVSPSYRHYEGAVPTEVRRSFDLYGGSHEVHYTHMWCPTEVGGDPNTTKIGVDRIFVQNGCFERAGMYGEPGGHDYFDNLFRFALFSWAAVEAPLLLPTIAPFGEKVIFIANDWQTGLVPLIIASHYRRWRVYEQARCLFIIHNMGYHGNFPNPQMYNYKLADPRETPKWSFCDLGLPDNLLYDVYKFVFPEEDRGDGGVVDDGECCKLLMGAIHIADRIVTVSPSYKAEVMEDRKDSGGFGLSEKVKARMSRFDGILNGIDTVEWDPMTDHHLAAPFNVNDMKGKAACKADIQEKLGLEVNPDKPLLAFIGRLAPQKGIDVIEQSLHWMMAGDAEGVLGDAQLIMMGSGGQNYAQFMTNAENQYKGRVCGYVGFSSEFEHKIIAGADILLMPSRYEPCGLPQMYAQRYGTVPIVHATGGLKDSVDQYEAPTPTNKEGAGTGWKFGNCDAGGLQWGIHNALKVYKKEPKLWKAILKRAMEKDFSWDQSAAKYEQLFEWVQMDDPVMRPWPFIHK